MEVYVILNCASIGEATNKEFAKRDSRKPLTQKLQRSDTIVTGCSASPPSTSAREAGADE